jgi:predicted nuclease of predicted toxin-antitoxin system
VADKLAFYLDENIEIALAEQLKRRGLDVVTALDLGLLGESDENHLSRAVASKRVLCTYDFDFVEMATAGMEHCGIVIGINQVTTISDWIRFLENLNHTASAETMNNLVRFVPKGSTK